MWLVELILLSAILGVPLGIGLHLWDKFWEKSKAEAADPKEAEAAVTSETPKQ